VYKDSEYNEEFALSFINKEFMTKIWYLPHSRLLFKYIRRLQIWQALGKHIDSLIIDEKDLERLELPTFSNLDSIYQLVLAFF